MIREATTDLRRDDEFVVDEEGSGTLTGGLGGPDGIVGGATIENDRALTAPRTRLLGWGGAIVITAGLLIAAVASVGTATDALREGTTQLVIVSTNNSDD